MTIEKLLECSASDLAAMSDEELVKHFEPYLNITRPDRESARLADKQTTRAPAVQSEVQKKLMAMPAEQSQMVLNMLKATGFDIKRLGKMK